jgi:hypothetical protein
MTRWWSLEVAAVGVGGGGGGGNGRWWSRDGRGGRWWSRGGETGAEIGGSTHSRSRCKCTINANDAEVNCLKI